MRKSSALAAIVVLAVAGRAGAHPPPPPDDDEDDYRDDYTGEKRPAPIEWSTWIRAAYGVGPEEPEPRARIISPVPAEEDGMHGWELAAGADVTVGVCNHGNIRLGAWAEARTSSEAVVGGELMLAGRPKKLDRFWYEGEGVWIVRAGGNRDVRTAALSYGYRAPWKLWGPWKGKTRYMIGVRLVGSVTQDNDDHDRWSATFGLETEPVGALRYLLGIRSWY